MYKPCSPSKSQSPYNFGRKNPEYRSPTYTHHSFQNETPEKNQTDHNAKSTKSGLKTPQNHNYYTYYNHQEKLENQKTEGILEKQIYRRILKNEETAFSHKQVHPRIKMHSQHDFVCDHSLSRIKRNSQIELNTYWNKGKIENEIKKEQITYDKKQLYSEIEQTEQYYSSQQNLKQSVRNYKTQCYLTGLDMQNKYKSYLKEVEKTKQMEEEILCQQELKIQDLRKQQELLRIAKSKFTQ